MDNSLSIAFVHYLNLPIAAKCYIYQIPLVVMKLFEKLKKSRRLRFAVRPGSIT